MNKPNSLLTTIQLALGFIAVLLFCSNVFLIVGFVLEKNEISNLKIQTSVTPTEEAEEDQATTDPTTKPKKLNIQEQTTTWIKGDTDFSKYISKIQDKTKLPFFYYRNGELASDIVLYSMIDTEDATDPIIQNIENYDVANLTFQQKFKSFNVAFTSGVFGAGGMCEQSYHLDTLVEGNKPGVCTNPGITAMSMSIDLLGVNKTYESANMYFVFTDPIQKADLEEFAQGLVRVN